MFYLQFYVATFGPISWISMMRIMTEYRLEITSDSVYSLGVQFQGLFRDFLFPFIIRIHPEADQTL